MTAAVGFEGVLRRFLDELDALDRDASEAGSGITGARVQDRLARAVARRLVFRDGAELPRDLGVDGPAAASLRAIVEKFFRVAEEAPDFKAAATEEARARLIAHDAVESHEGNAYWAYLGQWDAARLAALKAPEPESKSTKPAVPKPQAAAKKPPQRVAKSKPAVKKASGAAKRRK